MDENLHTENMDVNKIWSKESILPTDKEQFPNNAFKMLFDNSPVASFIYKPAGKVVIANAAACSLFGYTLDDFFEICYSKLFDNGEKAFIFSATTPGDSKSATGDITCIKKSGDRFQAMFSASCFKEGGQDLIYIAINQAMSQWGVIRDTDLLMNNTEEAFLLIDKNLVLTAFNRASQEFYTVNLGIRLETGHSILDYAQAERKDTVVDIYKKVFKGEKVESKVTIPTLNVGIKIYSLIYSPVKDEREEIIGAFVTAKDITKETLYLEDLEKTKAEIDKIMSGSLDMICRIADDDTILKISAASEQILGYRPDELIGKNLFEFLYHEDLEKTKEIANNIVKKKGSVANYYNRYQHKNGSLVYLEWMATWHQDEKVRYGIGRNVTEKVLAEQKLLQSEQRFKSLVQDGSDLIGILDAEANYQYVSPTSYPLLGYHPEEFIGKNAFDFIHPDDKEIVFKDFSALTINKKLNLTLFRFKHKNGTWRWIETTLTNLLDEPAVRGIVANSRDITERKHLEEKMLYEQQEKELLINATEDLIWSVNRDLKLIAANKSFIKNIESNTGNTIKPGDDIVLKEFPEEFLRQWQSYYSRALQGESFRVETYSSYSQDKSLVWTETIFNPIYNNKEIIGIACYSRDITERKNMEEKLKQSEAFLAEAQKLAKIGSWNFDFVNDELTWSDELYRVFGTDKKTFNETHNSFVNLVDEADRELIQKTSKNTQLTGEPFNIQYHITTLTGQKRIIEEFGYGEKDETGKVIRLFGTAQDITERKAAEERIIKSEASLIEAQAVAKVGSWETDLKTLEVIWSGETFRIFELDSENFMMTHPVFLEYVHPDDKEAVDKAFTDSLKSNIQEHSIEHRIITGNGHKKIIEERWKIVRNENGEPIKAVGTCQDISQRKEREEQLKLLESVIVNSNDAVIITEAELIDEPGPRIIYVNDAFTKMTGYTKAELIDKTPRILQGPKSDRTQLDKLKIAMQKGESREITIINYKKSGEEFYINFSVNPVADENGKITHFISIERDVTEQKKSEETIRSINERYDMAAKATSDVMWDWNLVTNEVIRSKEAIKKLFGFTDQVDIDNATFWANRVHPDDKAWIQRKFKEFFADHNAYYLDQEYRFKKANGNYAYIKDKGFIIRDEQGRAIRMIGAAQDITKLKENEVQLKQINAELEKRARELDYSNKELEQFAYVASHDLQEPLRMVSSFLTQIDKKYESVLDERGKKYIHFAVDGAKRMRQIILDLLEYSRIGRLDGEEEEVDLNGLMQEFRILYRKKLEDKKATISYKNLPVIQANRTPIRQVFQNLVANALLYAREDIAPKIKITAKDKITYWEFAVADNGIGINKEYFEKIFIIFQRLHSREHFAGTGMGLALTKKIVENIGGKIWLKSVEGKGSTFYFTIPKIK
ncbi:MAG: PAS domain S-box protein [Bacteroidota bacterium]|nr:PAS domain S-box protein [Bacteroidota bacterium]